MTACFFGRITALSPELGHGPLLSIGLGIDGRSWRENGSGRDVEDDGCCDVELMSRVFEMQTMLLVKQTQVLG